MTCDVKGIWYNPAASAFEGRIDIHRGGKSFRYPCTVEGPMDMCPKEIRQQMQSQAQRMSDSAPTLFSTL